MDFINKRDSIYDLKDNGLRICIHKLVGLGDELFLNCVPLNLKDVDLYTEDLDEAVSKSKEIIDETVENLRAEANRFINDYSKIKLVKW